MVKINQQSFLHKKSNPPLSLKNSMTFRQAWHIKGICSAIEEFKYHSQKLQRFIERCYKPKFIKEQIVKANVCKREDFLNLKKEHNQ